MGNGGNEKGHEAKKDFNGVSRVVEDSLILSPTQITFLNESKHGPEWREGRKSVQQGRIMVEAHDEEGGDGEGEEEREKPGSSMMVSRMVPPGSEHGGPFDRFVNFVRLGRRTSPGTFLTCDTVVFVLLAV